jgi:hypothetical protein
LEDRNVFGGAERLHLQATVFEVEDADAIATLRHRLSRNFWVQAGIEAQTGIATDRLVASTTQWSACPYPPVYDTINSKLDPTCSVRLSGSFTGFPSASGSIVHFIQGKARASTYYSIDPIRASSSPAWSRPALWAVRTLPTPPPTGCLGKGRDPPEAEVPRRAFRSTPLPPVCSSTSIRIQMALQRRLPRWQRAGEAIGESDYRQPYLLHMNGLRPGHKGGSALRRRRRCD